MQSEIITILSERYLNCSYSLSDKMLDRGKEDVKLFMASRHKEDLYFKFIEWQKRPNEIAVLTMYTYADIPIPKEFNLVFQIDKPENYIEINFTISQAIIDGWASIHEIGHGHKHILIIEFKDSVPDIFGILSDFDQ